MFLFSEEYVENKEIKVATKDHLLKIQNNASYILFKNSIFTEANENLTEDWNSKDIRIQNRHLSFSGNLAILFSNTENPVIEIPLLKTY